VASLVANSPVVTIFVFTTGELCLFGPNLKTKVEAAGASVTENRKRVKWKLSPGILNGIKVAKVLTSSEGLTPADTLRRSSGVTGAGVRLSSTLVIVSGSSDSGI